MKITQDVDGMLTWTVIRVKISFLNMGALVNLGDMLCYNGLTSSGDRAK